jgi:hypothetical protein
MTCTCTYKNLLQVSFKETEISGHHPSCNALIDKKAVMRAYWREKHREYRLKKKQNK